MWNDVCVFLKNVSNCYGFFFLLNKLWKLNILNYSNYIKPSRGSITLLLASCVTLIKMDVLLHSLLAMFLEGCGLKKVALRHKDSCHGIVTSLRCSTIVSLNFSSLM